MVNPNRLQRRQMTVEEKALQYLRRLGHFENDLLDYLSSLRFTGAVVVLALRLYWPLLCHQTEPNGRDIPSPTAT